MRAKTVNESYGNQLSYEEVIEWVKDATGKMGPRRPPLGPSHLR